MSSFSALLALALACIGLYGLLSYEVVRRTPEIGSRMAPGAQPPNLLRLIARQGIVVAFVGVLVGIAVASYFFWLLMTFNLFEAAGYFLFSGIGNIGDWAAVTAGWHPAWAWRVRLTALGIITYFILFVPSCLRELRPFLGMNAEVRFRRARQLTLVPYLAAGILSCSAGALNPVGPVLILISAAAASFGGHSGLAWMPSLLHGPRIPISAFQMPEIERSQGLIIAAALLAIVFIAVLGPGLKFHSQSDRLDPGCFARIHRSRIVNLDYIREIRPLWGGDCAVLMRDGTELTMSRTYRASLQAALYRQHSLAPRTKE